MLAAAEGLPLSSMSVPAIVRLPLLKTCLTLITAIYLLRGITGLIGPFLTSDPVVHKNSLTFWIVSSIICCIYGAFSFTHGSLATIPLATAALSLTLYGTRKV
ncbi:hypothetical protein E5672_13715 [Alteromonas portus]|uniref:Uncharacterized protein n=1 Tax=Alteromonas portus TaxID=2565549 RepID=A0A4U0ZFL6_9ALTE|nr:hypothetical protein E5672_13715 [Alteromonas portus]